MPRIKNSQNNNNKLFFKLDLKKPKRLLFDNIIFLIRK